MFIKGSGSAAEASVHARAFTHAIGKVFGNEDAFEKKFPSPVLLMNPQCYHGSTDGMISSMTAVL